MSITAFQRRRRELGAEGEAAPESVVGNMTVMGEPRGEASGGKDVLEGLESKTVTELEALARGRGIPGYSGMNNSELIEALGGGGAAFSPTGPE